MKFRPTLAALAALLFAPFAFANDPPPAAYLDPPSAVIPAKESATPPYAVHVSYPTGGGRSQAGSGTCIYCEGGISLVVTNAHVADRDTAYTVAAGKRSYPAKLVAGNPNWNAADGIDLALLEVDGELPVAPIATDAPAPGESLYQFGYGGRVPGQEPTTKTGSYLGVNTRTHPNKVSAVSTLPVQSGDSGSGVFNAEGELVAVTHGYEAMPNGSRVALAVPVTTVRTFVKTKGAPRFPRLAKWLEGRKGPMARLFHKPGKWVEVTPPAAKSTPKAEPPKAKTNPKAPPKQVLWRMPNGEFRYYPEGVTPDCSSGNCPLPRSAPQFSAPSACPDGNCQLPSTRRGFFRR